mmetsp:Transcript_9735/g.22190  ORF Transcript_9735/g.22190 Transcript_9735/m.22190 type:complete len:201 (-) Transcript_9735:1669-2271(-)
MQLRGKDSRAEVGALPARPRSFVESHDLLQCSPSFEISGLHVVEEHQHAPAQHVVRGVVRCCLEVGLGISVTIHIAQQHAVAHQRLNMSRIEHERLPQAFLRFLRHPCADAERPVVEPQDSIGGVGDDALIEVRGGKVEILVHLSLNGQPELLPEVLLLRLVRSLHRRHPLGRSEDFVEVGVHELLQVDVQLRYELLPFL